MDAETNRYKDLGALHTLLLDACPPDQNGRKSIPILAKTLGISHQYIYRWIDERRVPPGYVNQIVTLADGRIRLEQFHPYVFQ